MATHYSDAYIRGVPLRTTEDAPAKAQATFKLGIGKQLAANDVIKMFKLGAGMELLEVTLKCDDLDDGSNMTFDVGDNTTVDCIFDGSTLPQAGGVLTKFNRTLADTAADAFADAPYVVRSATSDIQITVLGTATQTTVDDAVRNVSVTITFQKEKLTTRTEVAAFDYGGAPGSN